MKKRNRFLKSLCLIASAALLVFSAGCASKNPTGASSGSASASGTGVKFPLEEPITYTFMVPGIEETSFQSFLDNEKTWTDLRDETNVNIKFLRLGTGNDAKLQVSLLQNSGGYGDVLMLTLSAAEASSYYNSGMLVPFTEYVNETYMPNFMNRVVAACPEVLNGMRGADGEIMNLIKLEGINGTYLESPLVINQTWLNKLGLQQPTTLSEFEDVLRAFKTQDPNGNGKQDEIPLMICHSGNNFNFLPLMGMFGVATKSGDLDAFVQVKNGKVEFEPTSQGFKDALKWYSKLWKEGLIYPEAFTAARATVESILTADTETVGVYTNNYRYGNTQEALADYSFILPPKADGYEACWYLHPGVTGTKNIAFVTDKCQNVDVLMSWFDLLYSFDYSFRWQYGEESYGRYKKQDDGTIRILNLDDATAKQINEDHPTVYGKTAIYTIAFTPEDWEKRIIMDDVAGKITWNSDRTSVYKLYGDAGVINDELWPRPYLTQEDTDLFSDISPDIFYTVDQFMTKTITGDWNVDEKWDSYVKELQTLGLDDYVALQQRAYDVYSK